MWKKQLFLTGFVLLFLLFSCMMPGQGTRSVEDMKEEVPLSIEQNRGDASSDKILVIFYGVPGQPYHSYLFKTLTFLGYDTTHLPNPAPGDVASHLAASSYDQIWIKDYYNTTKVINSDDAQAIVSWYRNNVKGNIIINAIAFGANYSHEDYSFPKDIVENKASAFTQRGGGLWIASTYANHNANFLLRSLNYATIGAYPDRTSTLVGNYSNEVGNTLLTEPNAFIPMGYKDGNLMWFAPTGEQPDGVVLYPVMHSDTTEGAVLISASLADNEGITFADVNLEAAVRAAIDKPDGDIYPIDVAGLTKLYAHRQGIIDLRGIEHLTSLKVLSLDKNKISDISPLEHLTSLKVLSLGKNKISNISSLARLTSLKVLSLDKNKISDISALEHLTSLRMLSLNKNKISDISALVNNTGLGKSDFVFLNKNPLSDYAKRRQLPALANRGVKIFY